jgi:hypothetical protein
VALREYNGLHLVLWSRVRLPHVRSIVVDDLQEATLEADVYAAGAQYLRQGDLEGLVEATREALAAKKPQRRWMRKRLPWDFAAEIDGTRARVVEISYGGVRLETEAPLPTVPAGMFSLAIPQVGVSIQAVLKWTTPVGAPGSHFSGVAVPEPESRTGSRWRAIVDALSNLSEG